MALPLGADLFLKLYHVSNSHVWLPSGEFAAALTVI
jgi:hypothetical protein